MQVSVVEGEDSTLDSYVGVYVGTSVVGEVVVTSEVGNGVGLLVDLVLEDLLYMGLAEDGATAAAAMRSVSAMVCFIFEEEREDQR